MDDQEARTLVGRVETQLERIEALPDAAARTAAASALQGMLELYGEGFHRLIRIVAANGGDEAIRACVNDELVAHLLMLHDLHPVGLRARVEEALADVRPYLATHGGNVELLAIEAGVVKLRLQGSCHGCPSSAITLKSAIEEAILKAAPDVLAIEAEGTEPDGVEAAPHAAGYIPLNVLGSKPMIASAA